MTRARMPGRGTPPLLHVIPPAPTWSPCSPPRCSLAESLSDDERAMLAELGVMDTPPRLRLVPTMVQSPAPKPVDPQRARRRQFVADWTGRMAVLAFAAWLLMTLLGNLEGLAP